MVIGEVPPPVKFSVSVAVSFVPTAAVGLNVIVTEQDAPLPSVPPLNEAHVVLCEKSIELVPVIPSLTKVIVLPELFRSVEVRPVEDVPCGTLPKASEVGVNVT